MYKMLQTHSLSSKEISIIAMKIKNNATDCEKLTQSLQVILENLGIKKSICFKISVCIGEAINNIIKHGYHSQLIRTIRIIFYMKSSNIRAEIMDSGITYAPPTGELLNIEEENGRGWHILKNWTDEIIFQRRGSINRLTLIYQLDNETG